MSYFHLLILCSACFQKIVGLCMYQMDTYIFHDMLEQYLNKLWNYVECLSREYLCWDYIVIVNGRCHRSDREVNGVKGQA